MTRRRLLGLLAVPLVGGAAIVASAAAAGGPVGASIAAAWRAFRNPALVEARAPEAPAVVDCARFDHDGDVKAPALDAQIARDFSKPRDEDLDDPQSGGVRSLSMPELPIPLTRRTLRYVKFFTRTEAGRAAFQGRFRRSALYRDHIEFALREAGLPEDLAWLAAIESGFDPRAQSPSGAAGLWQFMPETGALYGLEQSEWVDERRSIARSTTAAVAHLRDLYERLHRWDLALAAYNAGFDRIVRAMDKTAAQGERAVSFSELASARVIPEETANYVPQIHAFAIVAANRARFGLDREPVGPPPELSELAVPEGTRLRTVARSAGIPTAALRDLNPQILRDRVPPTGGDYLITLPAERVQHALATFPIYHDQEIVGQAEVEDVAPNVDAPGALPAFRDDALPERPRQLGRNRLPEIAGLGVDNHGSLSTSLLTNMSTFDAKLPLVAVGASSGWRASGADPLGVFAAASGAPRAKTVDAALEKQLGFLHEPSRFDALPTIMIGPGVVARILRDPSAAMTAVTVRFASTDPARRAGPATSDVSSTMTVATKDVDAAVELAAARVRLALGAGEAELAGFRRRAADGRRRTLAAAPYGRSWLQLGDALFPAGSPLAGTVIGAREDAYSARDTMLVDAMTEERGRAKASITIAGNVDEARAKQLLAAFLGGAGGAGSGPLPPHPSEERFTIEDDVPAPRLLLGFVVPGEGEAGDVSGRVLAEVLDNPKIGRLARRLAVGHSDVTAIAAQLDVGPRASVFAVDASVAPGHEADIEKALDGELDALAEDGATGPEVGAAKVYLKMKLEKQRRLEAATERVAAGAPHSTPLAHLRHALKPDATERAMRAVDDVTPQTVQAYAKKWLAKDHRVIVTTSPRAHAAEAGARTKSAMQN